MKKKGGVLRKAKSDLSTSVFSDLLEKYNLSSEQLRTIFERAVTLVDREEKDSFPLSIIVKDLTVLESVVKYLVEERKYSLHQSAFVLKKDERNLWHTYNNAKKKMSSRFFVKDSGIFVPLSLFGGVYSPLESIVVYLREVRQLSYREIGRLLARNERTIWVVYARARRKYEKF